MTNLARLCFRLLACLTLGSALHAQTATGTLEGRVTNPATGGVVERARLTIEGTVLETFSDSDGYYRLGGVPAGTARVRVTFSGFPPATAEVVIAAGQTAARDFELTPQGTAPAGQVVKLDQFVVATSREMSGAALAINEQRYAPNMKNVVATDEFGDIAEGNVAEFLKFMPGVNIDYAGGNARDVSLNGVPGDYVPVTLDGFGLASAVGGGAGGTNRSVGLDQVSINNLSRIEVSFSPTPESQGNALAGSVNLVPRSSFERTRPVLNFSTYFMMRDNAKDWKKTPAPRKPTRKIHPSLDLSYIAPVSKRFGFTLSAGFNRQYSGEPQIQLNWRGTQSPTNANFAATSFDRPYLSSFMVTNSGKETKRSSFGFTTDYKLTPIDRLSFSFTFSTFDVLINHNRLTFDTGRVNAGDFTTTSTRGAAGQGFTQLVTAGNDRTNWTYMPSIIWRHDGRVWKADAGFAYSRASNRNRNTESGFFDGTTARRGGLTIAFDDIFYLRPRAVTVTDAAGAPVDPYSLSNYVVTQATGNTRTTDDTKRTLYANLRRDFHGAVPLSLRTGLDFRQAARDQRVSNPTYQFVGADRVGSTTLTPTSDDRAAPFLDPSYSSRVAPYGFPAFQGISSEKLYEHFVANPTHWTTNANTSYRSSVNLSKFAKELVSAAYVRGDLGLFENRLKVVTGLRVEQTNIEAQGPLTDPNRNLQRDAQGRPILGANGRPLLIHTNTNSLEYSQLTFLDRGLDAEKEYLRLFPSVNVSYNLREDLIARAAWYTSIGRPDFNQYAGGVLLPDPENPQPGDQITINGNLAIKPWRAETVNVRLEYYLQGVGQLSVGAFRRDFENFFGSTTLAPTPELIELYGLDPAVYGVFPIVTQYNLDSTVRMTGVNVNYKQALTFLPRWARGVSIFGNGNLQRLEGPAATNFPGFIPKTASWGFSLNRERYSFRANWNYRSHQRRAAIAAGQSIEPGTFTYWSKRLYVDLNAELYFYKRFALFASLRNIGDAPDDIQVYGPSTPEHAQFRQRVAFGSLWSIGIKGTF
ncbi:MAG: carboxypeptidase regulatory-like domain-containing protein [Opitutaceae bacterium]|nr:carboxypeptidase regulatory-like domain-containing protein [Opitutaceae bacterium]